MGAIVFATDLDWPQKRLKFGKFLTVEGAENLETEGDCKEASDDFKKQEELLSETLRKLIL